jgi:hypothetical protein
MVNWSKMAENCIEEKKNRTKEIKERKIENKISIHFIQHIDYKDYMGIYS